MEELLRRPPLQRIPPQAPAQEVPSLLGDPARELGHVGGEGDLVESAKGVRDSGTFGLESPNGILRHRASRSVLDEKIIAETSSWRERESSDDLTTKTSPEDTEVASETAAEVPRPMVRPRRHPLELQHKSDRGRETRGRWMTWTGERWLIQEAERSMSSMVAQKSTLPRLGRPRSRGRPPSSAFPAPRVEAEANRCSPDPIFPEQKYGNAKHDQSRAVSCCQVAADHNYCFLGSVNSLSSSPSSLYAYLNFR
ncbi:hypothetical protein B296_00049429 [Ensete ventricosum]|uniref:Uncharacterized protein n=1 Tax=Ensete ventricosum TaxID=4639 RepID=A0A426YQQ5_ENSVE|nr:hypothetical protein B296_00049429 [Ensete ventricosum]